MVSNASGANESLISTIERLAEEYPRLVQLRDGHGRRAVDMATEYARLAMERATYFVRRYSVDDAPPLHTSATCAVLGATDARSSHHKVVLKLMQNQEQFERECAARRQGLADEFVVPVLQSSSDKDVSQLWIKSVDAIIRQFFWARDFPTYRYGIIMEFADRNMESIMRQVRGSLQCFWLGPFVTVLSRLVRNDQSLPSHDR